MDPNEFYSILSNLTVPDNVLRQAVEAQYQSILRETPDVTINGLLSVLSTSNFELYIRELAAVLLRRCLIDSEESIYFSLKDQTQNQLQSILLKLLIEETNNVLRQKICNIAGELGGNILEPKDWTALSTTAIGLCQSSSPNDREIGLNLISQIVESQLSYDDNFLSVMMQLLHINFRDYAQDISGLSLTMKALSYTIQSCRLSSQIDILKTLLDILIQSFINVINHTYNNNLPFTSHFSSFLEYLIEISDLQPNYFSNHLDCLLNSFVTYLDIENFLPLSLKFLLLEFFVILSKGITKKIRKLLNPVTKDKDYFSVCILPICLNMMTMIHYDGNASALNIIENNNSESMKEKKNLMDQKWIKSDTEEEINYETSPADVGESAFSRIVNHLGVRSTYNVISSLLGKFLLSEEWEKQYAGIQCIGYYLEVSAHMTNESQLEMHRKEVLGTLAHFLNHEHPRIRYITLFSLSQFLLYHGNSLESEQYVMIVSNIVQHINVNVNPSPRVRRNGIIALIQFIDTAPASLLSENPNQSSQLLSIICNCLNDGPTIVQESCVSAIISLAQTSKKSDSWPSHYKNIMPILKDLLSYSYVKGLESLWSQTLECITIIGESVGKVLFYQDALELMEVLTQTQRQLDANKANPNDTNSLEIELIKAWVSIARTLGSEFLPYLPVTMDKLFRAMSQDITAQENDDDDEDDETSSDVEMIETDEGWITVRTSAIEEQSSALEMILHLAEKLQEHFYPYVEQTAKHISKLIVSPHEDIRSFSVAVLPEIVRATGRALPHNRSPLIEIANYCLGLLIRFVESEGALDLVMNGLQAIRAIILFASIDWSEYDKLNRNRIIDNNSNSSNNIVESNILPKNYIKFFDNEQMLTITNCLKVVLRDSLQRRCVLRAETQVSNNSLDPTAKDEDDEDDEKKFFKESLELHFNISEVLGILFQTHTHSFFKIYSNEWTELITNLSHPYCLIEDRRFSFLIISDVVSYGLIPNTENTLNFFKHYFPLIHEICLMNEDVELKRTCSYILGIAFEKHSELILKYLQDEFNNSLKSLRGVITVESEKLNNLLLLNNKKSNHQEFYLTLNNLMINLNKEEEEILERGQCIDNAIASVGIIIEQTLYYKLDFHQEYLLGQWLLLLPLKYDREEGEKSIKQLIRLLKNYFQYFLMKNNLIFTSLNVLFTVYKNAHNLFSSDIVLECGNFIYQLIYNNQQLLLPEHNSLLPNFFSILSTEIKNELEFLADDYKIKYVDNSSTNSSLSSTTNSSNSNSGSNTPNSNNYYYKDSYSINSNNVNNGYSAPLSSSPLATAPIHDVLFKPN